MTSILLDLSGKLPFDLVDALRIIINTATAQGTPTLVVGAAARDLIFEYYYGLGSRRATRDVDFGIAINSWEEFDQLAKSLITSGNFSHTANIPHRLTGMKPSVIIDIIPFGGIESVTREIAWPPDHSIVMSTRGFREAYQSALMVRLAEDLEAKVASPAGFALLKLIAWSDRNEHRDAQDLAFVMLNYLDAGNKERLYVDHIDLLDDEFDYILTGVRLLGRDIGSIVEEDIREELLRILSTAGSANGSLNRLAAAIATRGIGFDSKFDNAYQMLSILRRGILDC